ncbi:hypothetical protein DFH07DRAFT_802179 [Mycena maculata]|uniref:Uncharacterized protein n=1 Tax=Mycena maculata TaxID=230809 RepID=A0AAD7JW79_9AGAR|nr:hypothetical protein DFH07DRAFT_802179 [Mycena maculata]
MFLDGPLQLAPGAINVSCSCVDSLPLVFTTPQSPPSTPRLSPQVTSSTCPKRCPSPSASSQAVIRTPSHFKISSPRPVLVSRACREGRIFKFQVTSIVPSSQSGDQDSPSHLKISSSCPIWYPGPVAKATSSSFKLHLCISSPNVSFLR